MKHSNNIIWAESKSPSLYSLEVIPIKSLVHNHQDFSTMEIQIWGEERWKRFYPHWSRTFLHLSTHRVIHVRTYRLTIISHNVSGSHTALQGQAPIVERFGFPLTSMYQKGWMYICIPFMHISLTVEYLGQKVSVLTVLAGSASCPMKRLSEAFLTSGKRECALPRAFVNGYHQSPQSKSGFY